MAVSTKHKISRMDRLYEDERGYDFIGRTKLWYGITAALIVAAVAAILIRGFSLSIDFEGGTTLSMPAGDLKEDEVSQVFEDSTGVEPEQVHIVGAGDSETLEIVSERLSQEDVNAARAAIYDNFQPKDENGKATPDAIGSSTVSESWGSSITQRMLIAMLVFLVAATVYVAIRLQKNMAFAAIIALIADGVIIAGIYALFGFEVSPAVIIGLLTVLTFSMYDSVIVFDKINENTEGLEGQRKKTYAELTNLAINQTVMRSISTSVISALPIIALFVVAVWLMGIGTLRDLALIQLIGVVEGIFSSIFFATPLVVTFANMSKRIKRHNKRVTDYRAGKDENAAAESGAASPARTVVSPASATATPAEIDDDPAESTGQPGATWRPGR
ncbi:protein translocase subunit SecF [Corynebacterium marquesiae]|uniref:protein translocase subunit SecF n=1 Tax=Corynebacterium TaxID=1716 RepID=UPI000A6F35EF|nr:MULTISPECIES: protein translocase subunit SecF [Corynebacterium]MDK8454271.1 protein translocase subunit SecF [Corynebacterium marquesiae]MDK8479531.1 protein translocase subunit SecF [Corynebacterium marquesiae]MDK8494964.1 protein translocase subunit SecF [Corynebacterium marquesiae]MDK8531160.1 protein translocase subunit SecF [Corynebacterium marquesiae]MDK8724388.1 protein translocase subunit SecF [Corynebacterium marquesiae]